VFAICSEYYRVLIRKAKEKLGSKPEKVGLEIDAYKIYPVEIVKKYFDLIYSANVTCLTVNEIVQLIDLIYDCGYTDENEYPWNFRK
jgi:hypothetical protein